MEKNLFESTRNILDNLADYIDMNMIIQCEMRNTDTDFFKKNDYVCLTYIKGWCGSCGSKEFNYSTTLNKKDNSTDFDQFTIWKDDLKNAIISNCENDGIVLYQMYDCDYGKYSYYKIIYSLEDLKNLLIEIGIGEYFKDSELNIDWFEYLLSY